ncbi:MAG: L-aspartate oxidase [Polyangiaceae bacterium]|nr:L-aspartate oxidase [Polyangiaceae bacterium]
MSAFRLAVCARAAFVYAPGAVSPIHTDFLVIGSGVAGLTFALDAAAAGEVTLVTKRAPEESNSTYAQGGIAAVTDPTDTFDAHIRDTLVAGAGLCHEVAVERTVRDGPARIAELRLRGAAFDVDESGALSLTREGGHSARRVVHATDATGREVTRALLAACARHPNIRVLDGHTAIDLIMLTNYGGPERCVGAYVLNEKGAPAGSEATAGAGSTVPTVETFLARATVLAAGGAGKVYLYTTNPDVATGDGVAMAYRAGAEIGNMEFYQFHPTCLFHPKAKSFLISEALRGEGAILRLPDGTAFMEKHDARKELAPRDIVARAIDYEMKRLGVEHVLLDITHKPASFVTKHFPTIHEACLSFGLDITREPIPVVPAAHYMCGGITTDMHGRTTIPGLFAVGECAFTGLHGANRLASNSLLEGLVFGHRAAVTLAEEIGALRAAPLPTVPEWTTGSAVPSDEAVVVAHNWDELRRTMWNYVGIVRSDTRLRRAARRIALLQEEIREYYWRHLVTRDLLELRNIATVAELIVASAASRHESRGLHYTLDYPHQDEHLCEDTIIRRGVPAHPRNR